MYNIESEGNKNERELFVQKTSARAGAEKEEGRKAAKKAGKEKTAQRGRDSDATGYRRTAGITISEE
ncbi:MAG: hypothetical protein ACM3OC_01545 [Deltaproteobacteria bacterium]